MASLFRYAWKSWKNALTTAVLAVVALAIGIGSATAIYTVAEAVLLKPLPYREAGRFVAFYGARRNEPGQKSFLNYNNLREFTQKQRSFDLFGWFTNANFNLVFGGEAEHVNGVRVTPWLVRGLGVSPKMGRWFENDSQLAVISDRLWHRLGGRAEIIGKPIALDGKSYTVAGVMPAWFRLPLADPSGATLKSDLWIPLDPQFEKANAEGIYFCYARRKPGVTFAQADADAQRMAAEYAREHPDDHGLDTAKLESLREVVSGDFRPTLLLLIAGTALLLLITCANVSGLLVTRAVARSRETAIRLALGAARRQLLSQYFSEGLLVSFLGAFCGIALSIALVHTILRIGTDVIAQAEDISVDWTALLFAAGAAFLASLLTSLAPLWQAMRTAPNEVLNDGVRASAGVRSRRLSQGLVVAEIALTFTLLATGALLVAQLNRLNHVNPGFDPNGLYTFRLSYSGSARLAQYQAALVNALESTPGVSGVALTNQLPVNGCCLGTTIFPEGAPERFDAQRVAFLPVNSQFFATMRIPLRAGRVLTAHDSNEKIINAVINQAAAGHYWPQRNALGAYGHFLAAKGDRFQIVGIVGDVRNDGLNKPTVPEVYLLSTLAPPNPAYFIVRSSLPEKTLMPAVRQAIRRINPDQPIYDVHSYQEIIEDSLTFQRASSLLTSFFAIAALLLSALGIYGVVAYSVRQRTVEIGTRMALGAVSRDLWKLVLGGGFKMAAVGLVAGGIAVAFAAVALVKSSVLQSVEPWPFVYSTAAIAGIALIGSFYPAWRATQLSPMVAIRDQPGSMWRVFQERIRHAFEDVPVTSDDPLLGDFVNAARDADSAEGALQIALATLCERAEATFALLFEKTGTGELRAIATYPAGATATSFPADGFLLKRFRFYQSTLPVSEQDLEAWSRWAAEQRPEYLEEIETLKTLGVRLAAPLKSRKEIVGLLLLGPSANGNLKGWPHVLALMLENAKLTQRVVEQERLNRDLALAAEVQKRLLPEGVPESEVSELAAFTLPARTVGGDYYDFIRIGDHDIGIALADVAGKGIPAALIMSVVQASLRILSAEANVTLPQLVAKMNRFLHRSTGVSSYATFFYAQMDEASRQLRYVNAGHNPPVLIRSQREGAPLEELATGGMIIGMFAQADYQEAQLELQTGDVLVAFTDGVTEALNEAQEEFGEERLKSLLRGVVHLPVKEMAARISAELRAWIGHAPQHDDLTFLILKVR
ncbi:MAG TPA: ADOP family duplicated permease [Bryobacteraceae bacterium]